MSDGKMSCVQKLFIGLVSPSTAAAMEAESRSWLVWALLLGTLAVIVTAFILVLLLVTAH